MQPSSLWALTHGPDAAESAQAHVAIKADPVLWDRLAFTGVLDGGNTLQEQRQCPACDTSLYLPADVARLDEVLAQVSGFLSRSLVSVRSVRQRPALPVMHVPSETPEAGAVTMPYVAGATESNPVATAVAQKQCAATA